MGSLAERRLSENLHVDGTPERGVREQRIQTVRLTSLPILRTENRGWPACLASTFRLILLRPLLISFWRFRRFSLQPDDLLSENAIHIGNAIDELLKPFLVTLRPDVLSSCRA